MFLRAFIAALLVHLYSLVTSGVAIAAMLHQLPQVFLDSLKQTLTLRETGLSDLIAFLLGYVADPIERALHAICSWLGLCPPEVGHRMPRAKVPADDLADRLAVRDWSKAGLEPLPS